MGIQVSFQDPRRAPARDIEHVIPIEMEEDGDPGMIRTCDKRFRKPLLYPSELRGHDRFSGWGVLASSIGILHQMFVMRFLWDDQKDSGQTTVSRPSVLPQVKAECTIRYACARALEVTCANAPAASRRSRSVFSKAVGCSFRSSSTIWR